MAKSNRVTLTKSEAASAYGQRLIHQIMAMSDDGELTLAEVRVLHALAMEGPLDINAVPFLRLRAVRILLDNQLDSVEMYQLRRDMERVVPKDIRENLTILLSRLGLPFDDEEEETGTRSWRSDPITARQFEFLRDLGAKPNERMTKGQASTLIDELLARRPPSPRQQMVIRFFDRVDLMRSTKEQVSAWLDDLYLNHEDYERAWHLFKLDIGDDGTMRDPSMVPIGAYRKYLRSRPVPIRPSPRNPMWFWVALVIAGATLVLGFFVLSLNK